MQKFAADDDGIHLLDGEQDTVVSWDEIEDVRALRYVGFTEVSIGHRAGIDFVFHGEEDGFNAVIAGMVKHLSGFTREAVEAARSFEHATYEESIVWRRPR